MLAFPFIRRRLNVEIFVVRESLRLVIAKPSDVLLPLPCSLGISPFDLVNDEPAKLRMSDDVTFISHLAMLSISNESNYYGECLPYVNRLRREASNNFAADCKVGPNRI